MGLIPVPVPKRVYQAAAVVSLLGVAAVARHCLRDDFALVCEAAAKSIEGAGEMGEPETTGILRRVARRQIDLVANAYAREVAADLGTDPDPDTVAELETRLLACLPDPKKFTTADRTPAAVVAAALRAATKQADPGSRFAEGGNGHKLMALLLARSVEALEDDTEFRALLDSASLRELLHRVTEDREARKRQYDAILAAQHAHTEELRKMREVLAIVSQLLPAGLSGTSAGPQQPVAEAVADIARGSEQGDARLQRALALLKENKPEEAVPLLQAVAEDVSARIRRDRKEAATAYRNLGAIAGLRDPKRALDAYAQAAEYDPDDMDSLLWAGWLAMDRGDLATAEPRLRRVLDRTGGQPWFRHWARLALGDIAASRGNTRGALALYRTSHADAELAVRDEPKNQQRQRDLSVSHDKIGDMLAAQGDRAGALAAYRDSLAIAENLARADPGNAGWQRDLSVSHNKIGDMLAAQGDRAGALAAYRDGFAIREKLAQSDPGNAEWQVDVLWSHWRLAGHGDDAATRWHFIVARLRALQAEGKLTAEQASWLPVAEAEVAKLGGR